MTPEFRKFYDSMLETVGALIKLDPPADSPEGRLLVGLATTLEEFEKTEFPLVKVELHGRDGEAGILNDPGLEPLPSYTCPRCGAVSYNANDIAPALLRALPQVRNKPMTDADDKANDANWPNEPTAPTQLQIDARRIKALEEVVKFCHDIATEEYPHQQKQNIGAELVLRHIIRKCASVKP